MAAASGDGGGAGGPCGNPLCSCDPCGCGDSCTCGAATLGQLEQRVMDAVWGEGDREVTARSVADLFPEHAYTTVATVLDRLVTKGLVRRRKVGRTVRFSAVGTGGAHTAVLMHRALASGPDADAALVRFAETLSAEEVAVLRGALEERSGTLADRGAST